MDTSLAERVRNELAGKIGEAFGQLLEARRRRYGTYPREVPEPSQVEALVSACAIQNAAIAGSAELAPGAHGLVEVLPELALVVREQIGLVYDIAAAHGRQAQATPELLLGVLLAALDADSGGLLVADDDGEGWRVGTATPEVFEQHVAQLCGRIARQALKSATSRWLPGIGATALAVWANYLTRRVGHRAAAILQGELAPGASAAAPAETAGAGTTPTPLTPADGYPIGYYKLQLLIGLMRARGRLAPGDRQFVASTMARSLLTPDQRSALVAQLEAHEPVPVCADDAIALLAAMTALARKDSYFHVTEKLYIQQIGQRLGFRVAEIEDVMYAD